MEIIPNIVSTISYSLIGLTSVLILSYVIRILKQKNESDRHEEINAHREKVKAYIRYRYDSERMNNNRLPNHLTSKVYSPPQIIPSNSTNKKTNKNSQGRFTILNYDPRTSTTKDDFTLIQSSKLDTKPGQHFHY